MQQTLRTILSKQVVMQEGECAKRLRPCCVSLDGLQQDAWICDVLHKYNFTSKELTEAHEYVLPNTRYNAPTNSYRCAVYADRSRNESAFYVVTYCNQPKIRTKHGQFLDIVTANMAANLIMHPDMSDHIKTAGYARLLVEFMSNVSQKAVEGA